MAGFAAFGKITSLGDFVRIGAQPSFVEPWDQWLQAALLAGRAACGAEWQARYLTAPIWRFSLSQGLAGPQAVLGVLMPSVDRVGRQFPLTLYAIASDDAAASHAANTDTFAALEDVALDTLSDGSTRDTLAVALAAMPPLHPVPASSTARDQSVWSALIGDQVQTRTFPALPTPEQSVGFFEMTASALPVAQTENLS